jgi:protein gp37
VGESSAIAWTDHTFNPWWGCERVSPGCQNCYAETFAKRVGHGGSKPVIWGKRAERRFLSDAHWREPIKWDRDAAAAGRPALVFCASMADVFEARPELDEPRARLFRLIDETPNLIWLLLTKRPQHVIRMSPARWLATGLWPENVWVGTTVENAAMATERIPWLAEIPAPVRFLSMEPLLEAVSLEDHLWHGFDPTRREIDWVIVGGESGPGHRPFDPAWARTLRDECTEAGVPFFFKQHGGATAKAGGHLLDGEVIQQFPERVLRGAAQVAEGEK